MDVSRVVVACIFLFCSILLTSEAKRNGHHLHVGFYSKTCPNAEAIVADVVSKAVLMNSTLPAGLIRLHFHDCFVNGCDASILLDSTPSGEPVEKQSPFNGYTLRGLEVIDDAKERLEQECPGIVSCADTLAFAARDAVVLSGLPYYLVPSGRRDGLSSLASVVPGSLPSPRQSVDDMVAIFTKKGLSMEEMVVLTGAHSIGVSHCSSFSSRLYNYSLTEEQDPSLNTYYSFYLKWICPRPGAWISEKANEIAVPFDESPTLLDTTFYANILQGKAILQSDQLLADDPRTSEIVKTFALNPTEWSQKFGKAMVWMGRVDVLTGRQGEIRKNCRSVN